MATRTDHRWIRLALCAAIAAALGAMPAYAQDAAATEPAPAETAAEPGDTGNPNVSAEARAILDRMTAAMTAQENYAVRAVITRDEVVAYGYKIQYNETAQMWVSRPNRLRLEVDGDIKTRVYTYDGSELTMFAPDANAYSVSPAPGTLRELAEGLLATGVDMPMIDFLYHGSAGSLDEAALNGVLVGDSEIDGVPVHHLAFRQPDVDWQIWVERGERALPRKLVITTRYTLADPQYSATLTWESNARLDASRYRFTPPAGANKVPLATPIFPAGDAE